MNNHEYINKFAEIIKSREEEEKELKKTIFSLKQDLLQLMNDEGASEVVTDKYTVTITERPVYDQNKLLVLLEMLDAEELIEDGAYVPEHTKTVEGKFNVNKLRKYMKRGDNIRKIIEDSRATHSTSLKVQDK